MMLLVFEQSFANSEKRTLIIISRKLIPSDVFVQILFLKSWKPLEINVNYEEFVD